MASDHRANVCMSLARCFSPPPPPRPLPQPERSVTDKRPHLKARLRLASLYRVLAVHCIECAMNSLVNICIMAPYILLLLIPLPITLRRQIIGTAEVKTSAGAAVVDKPAAAVADKADFNVTTHPAFALVESVVLDGISGERLFGFEIARGSTRCETLRFHVHAPLGKLRRKTTTAMRMVGMWQNVATELLELGEYEPLGTAQVHEFAMPVANIPTSPFAAGRFKTEVVYSCEALEGVELRREWDIEFRIV